METWQAAVVFEYLHETFEDTRETYWDAKGNEPLLVQTMGRTHMELDVGVLCSCLGWGRPLSAERCELLEACFHAYVHRTQCGYACVPRHDDGTYYHEQRWARCREFARRYRARIFKEKLTLLLGE